MSNYHIPLLPGKSYHLFNRAVGNEKLFRTDDNYRFFLARLAYYILPVAGVFTFSLMPNHFHLLIRVKDEELLIQHFELKKKRAFIPAEDPLPDFVMEQFSNWLNSYSKAFNKQQDRKGSLFMDYTKRSAVQTERDLTSFIFYIHKNAVHHGLCGTMGEWKYDGYRALLSDEPTLLLREEVISRFGTKESFIKFHDQPVDLKSTGPFDTYL